MSDEIIRFNTEDAVKMQPVKPIIAKTFSLVDENDPILKETIPEFDFNNLNINPNEFSSTLVETCKLHKGYGLSANQCGFKYRMFVMGAAGTGMQNLSANGQNFIMTSEQGCTGPARVCTTNGNVDLGNRISESSFNFFFNTNDKTWNFNIIVYLFI